MQSNKKIAIIPFEPQYAQDFADLNIAWLEKYFFVEPHDVLLLEQCEKTIINKGGYIFFAKIDTTIVGTFSLIKKSENIYELGKMAVSPEFQGHKIGQQLMTFCIDFAEKQQWKKLILYSNRILKNAIHIYKKNGFVEIELENDSPYQRSNIKMEFIL
ncbi:hypothetical protein GCM10022393_21230 [Aquimarina addita]|uniref:N-acetyltransferase domain-containing protein n=1 Tax=Aquimarina addita TaxID=870485 RepID=A0ABP6UIT6_9FLAO